MRNMIVTIILILLAVLFAGSIESNLREVFSDPEWIDVSEWDTSYESIRM